MLKCFYCYKKNLPGEWVLLVSINENEENCLNKQKMFLVKKTWFQPFFYFQLCIIVTISFQLTRLLILSSSIA